MSSIYITSQLHRSWKIAVLSQKRELLEKIRPETGLTLAPRPSQMEPPPEAFGEVFRAVVPFVNHGLNPTVFAAIVAATAASVGASAESLYPAQYLGGAPVSNGRLISWPRDWCGCPFVLEEPFPINTSDLVGVNHLAPFPEASIGQLVLSGHSGQMVWPQLLTTIPESTEEDTRVAHPREIERVRAGGTGVVLKTFPSTFRYTGCLRLAEDSEIDALFTNILRPECYITAHNQSLRDWFSMSGASMDAFERSAFEMERSTRPQAPSSPAQTNVPSRRPRRNIEEQASPASSQAATPPLPVLRYGSRRIVSSQTPVEPSPVAVPAPPMVINDELLDSEDELPEPTDPAPATSGLSLQDSINRLRASNAWFVNDTDVNITNNIATNYSVPPTQRQ